MTHYQKLATIIFRSIGIVFLIIGVIIGLICLVSGLNLGRMEIIIFVIFYTLPLIILGIGFFYGSKILAKLACLGLDKSDEQK